MTYNVFGGMLNLTRLNSTEISHYLPQPQSNKCVYLVHWIQNAWYTVPGILYPVWRNLAATS